MRTVLEVEVLLLEKVSVGYVLDGCKNRDLSRVQFDTIETVLKMCAACNSHLHLRGCHYLAAKLSPDIRPAADYIWAAAELFSAMVLIVPTLPRRVPGAWKSYIRVAARFGPSPTHGKRIQQYPPLEAVKTHHLATSV